MSRGLERLGRRPAVVACLALAAGLGLAKQGAGTGLALLLQAAGLGLLGAQALSASRGAGPLRALPGGGQTPRPAIPGASARALHAAALLLVLSGTALLYGAVCFRTVSADHLLAAVPPGDGIEARIAGRVVSVAPRPEAGPRVDLDVFGLQGRRVRGRIVLSLSKSPGALLAGDLLAAPARLRRVLPALLPGGLDREESLASRGIRLEAFAAQPSRVAAGLALWRWIPALSDRVATALAGAAPPSWAARARWEGQHGPFLNAILLGRREALAPELAEVFRRSGLYHLFAISGMNLALIAAAVYGLLGRALGRRAGAAASAGAIALYSALTAGQPSVYRASLMVLVHLGGIVLGRRPDGLSSVCLAAGALMLWQPGLVSDLGFQLTVLATASVLLYTAPLARQIRLPDFLAQGLAASCAAQAAVLPLLLAHFRELSLYGLLSSLLAAPPFAGALCLSMLGAALVALGLGPESLPVHLALAAAGACASALFEIAALFASVPGAVAVVPRLGPEAVAICAALWASFLLRPTARARLVQATLVLAFAAAVLAGLRPEARPPVQITFLAAGNADCALLELPGGRSVLVDGAGDPRGRVDVGNLSVVPFLWHQGIRHLETAYLSHAHPDHGLGLLAVLAALPVDRLRLGGPVGPKGLARELALAAGRSGTDLEMVNPYTDARYTLEENDRSLVLRLRFGGFSALFPGDVEQASEHELADTYGASLAAAVLKVAHHGSCTSSAEPFLAAVRPRLAVVSVGADNPFGHPCPGALERLRRALGPERVLLTSEGSVRVSSDGRRLEVERYAGGRWLRLWTEPLPEAP